MLDYSALMLCLQGVMLNWLTRTSVYAQSHHTIVCDRFWKGPTLCRNCTCLYRLLKFVAPLDFAHSSESIASVSKISFLHALNCI